MCAVGVLVPAGVEGEHVLLEHVLKQPDHVIAVLQYQLVLCGVPTEDLETERLVELPRSLKIFDGQTDRKRAEFHKVTPPSTAKCVQNVRPDIRVEIDVTECGHLGLISPQWGMGNGGGRHRLTRPHAHGCAWMWPQTP